VGRNSFAQRPLDIGLNQQEVEMKKLMIASACVLALTTGGAFAQSQSATGTSSEDHAAPTKHMNKHHMKKGTTTGMAHGSTTSHKTNKSMGANPSSEGNVGPGTNNNAAPQPGGR
jgi:hypothetical protein